MDFKLEVD